MLTENLFSLIFSRHYLENIVATVRRQLNRRSRLVHALHDGFVQALLAQLLRSYNVIR
jgi:hypothetical protein